MYRKLTLVVIQLPSSVNIGRTPEFKVQSLAIQDHTSSFLFESITEEDVQEARAKLYTNKTAGVDNISARMLKMAAPGINSSLCDLFNASFSMAQIPTEWKAAKIITIPKVKQVKSMDEYFPVSTITRLFESLVYPQVYRYLNRHNNLNEAQSGFRRNYSKQDVLLKTIDD